jgi:acyl carrier protein
MKQALSGNSSASVAAALGKSADQKQFILGKVQDIVRDVIEDEAIVLHMGTTARDVAGWDSLMNIRIILAAEKAFGIKVSTTEIMSLRNVGDFVRLLVSRQHA